MAGSRTLKLSILADVDNLKKNLDSGSKEVEGFGGKLEKFGKVAAAAFAAAAAAALAYAGKLAIEGVKAAIEDEAAQNRLANALKNVTGATNTQIQAVEGQISKMSLAFGVADDLLRPAYQRLAVATGSLSEAEKGLQLALDISAATGKSVEAVANALGKAYEGNTGALGRLGIGLSTAEIKSLGLDGTMKQLAQTFGGAATTQANTLEGQIARLKVGFDEAKESVGAALLPIVERLMNYFVNTLIPKFQEAKEKAVDPIVKAFKDNEAAMRDLWTFTKTYLVPLFENTLVKAIQGVGKTIAGIINIVGAVVTQIKKLANDAISFINDIIRAYNKLPFNDINTITPISMGGGQGSITTPGGQVIPIGSRTSVTSGQTELYQLESELGGTKAFSNVLGTAMSRGLPTDAASLRKLAKQMEEENRPDWRMMSFNTPVDSYNQEYNTPIPSMPTVEENVAVPVTQPISIIINGAIDPISTARQIADILNTEAAISGSFTDLGTTRFANRIA